MDENAALSSLRSYGLHIEGLNPTGRSLRVSGTAGAMEATFKAGMAIYHSAAQGEFRAREGEVSAPAEIAGLVEAVVGLDQRNVAKRKTSPHSSSLSPLRTDDLEERYDFPKGDGAKQKIAIAEFGSPLNSGSFLPPAYFPDDVTLFCKQQSRPTPSIDTVPVNIAPLTLAQLQTLPTNVANAVRCHRWGGRVREYHRTL
jgi:kumamolisin